MKSHATKLIELTERNAETIAKQWYYNVKMNPKTVAYHKMPEERAIRQALKFYSNFHCLFFSDKPFEEADKVFSKFAEELYREHIPLPQAMYSLMLMRRHLWLYAESQVTFLTAVEHHHAAESLSRTILMFDYAIYVLAVTYEALSKKDIAEKIKTPQIKDHFAAEEKASGADRR